MKITAIEFKENMTERIELTDKDINSTILKMTNMCTNVKGCVMRRKKDIKK